MENLKLSIVALSVLLVACASYPRSPDDQATYHANLAREGLKKGDGFSVVVEIEKALDRPTGGEKIKNLFSELPSGKELYCDYIRRNIEGINSVDEARSTLDRVNRAAITGILNIEEAKTYISLLNEELSNKNKKGVAKINLGDKTSAFPKLQEEAQQAIIVENTIKTLQKKSEKNRPVSDLMDYISKIGPSSPEGVKLGLLLPSMNITKPELYWVEPLFPDFAKTRNNELTIKIYLQAKNADRIFVEDIKNKISTTVKGIEWSKATDEKTINLTIEKIRNDERVIPEKSQTISYAQYEVNLLGAALLMPRNATYIYDIISGGAEIEYGYVVSADLGGKLAHDQIVRGRIGGEYRAIALESHRG